MRFELFLKYSNNTAIVNGSEKIDYLTLIEKINYYASFTKDRNADKIAIFSENRPEWIYALYSGWVNNSTVVPIDYLSTADEVAYILNDSKPEIIFTSNESEKVLNEAVELADYEPAILIMDDIESSVDSSHEINFPHFEKDKTLLIIYTSGTTGSPKGVMLTTENLLANLTAVTDLSLIHI